MKRVLALIFVVVLLLTSCSSNKYEPFVVYEVVYVDVDSSSANAGKIRLPSSRYVELRLDRSKNFDLFGRQFTAKYIDTGSEYLYDFVWDSYECVLEDGSSIFVSVNKNSGKLGMYVFIDKSYDKDVTVLEYGEEDCLKVAEDYLESYLPDFDQYELMDSFYRKKREYYNSYRFDYVKYKDGMRTCDVINIEVSDRGEIIYLVFHGTGIVDDAEVPSEETLNEMRTKVNGKLDVMYKEIRNMYPVTYSIDKEIFTRLYNGRYAIEYCMDVSVDRGEPEGLDVFYERFIVYLD